jgi:hypothetical protein
MRGLPHAYRDIDAPLGTTLLVEVSGLSGGQWFLHRESSGWSLVKQPHRNFASRVTIPEALAWHIFTKGIDRDSARAQIQIEGDQSLGEKVLHLTAIVG